MSTGGEQADGFQVITLEAARWGIETLKEARVHPFFLAYLHIRKRGAELGTSEDIVPNWDELGTYMHVRGGPPGKPYYRPLWHGKDVDPARYWLNRNLAGSYAPSSLRNVPIRVIDIRGGHFALRPGHARLAFEHLLYGQRLSAIALAAYLYRDFGFVSDRTPGPEDLREAFAEDFYYSPNDEEFELLFDPWTGGSASAGAPRNWFEPISDTEEDW